jgi:hypothetical protein
MDAVTGLRRRTWPEEGVARVPKAAILDRQGWQNAERDLLS